MTYLLASTEQLIIIVIGRSFEDITPHGTSARWFYQSTVSIYSTMAVKTAEY